MCKMPSKYVKQRCRKNIDEKYSMNTSIITKKRFLRYVKGYSQSTDTPVWPSPHRSLCPRVNMYYAFNEDTNPFTRISEFTETTCTCSYDVNTSPHFEPPLDPFADRDPYSEDEARRKYLDTKPVCFVIFGKPGLNSRKLAKMIADSWNCVLISPETLVKYEIERKTEKGRWIEQVLQAGRGIGAEVIMNLIECRVNQRDVLHRGYIIEGLPLIPNNPDLDYSHYPHESMGETEHNSIVSNSETSIYGENEEIKPTVSPKTREEVNDEKREDSTSEQSFVSMRSESYNLTANPFNTDSLKMMLRDSYERDIERQIEEIFNIWPIKPQVIIYMICPDQDVISKRYQFRLDPHSGNIVDIGLLEIKEELYTLFSHTMIAPNIDIPIELYQEIMIEQKLVDKDFKKHLLRRVSDMRPNVEIQCNIYERYALPCIEKQVLKHNPQYVIRVDGRTAVTHMFQIVQVKLRTLPLLRVILPKEVLNSVEAFQEGEESSVGTPDNNFEGETNEEVFQELASKGIVSSRFPWRMSRWKFLCPVALAKGQTIGGNFKYTVSFMNKLFFLSSLEAMEMFMQNPRPFLLPPNPRPTCKIAVFGPKYSGKSKLSYDLTRVVGGTVIDIQSIENKLIENHLESNIAAAVRDILDELNEKVKTEREERETARLSALQSWYMDVKNLVNQLQTYVLRQENVIEEKSLVTDSNELKAIRKKLKEYNIEFIETDKNLRERINKDDTVLLEFVPDYLQNEEPPVRELTDHDPEFIVVLKNRMTHIRHTSLNVTAEERATMLIETIKMVPNEPIGDGLFREGGWILDGMYTDPEIWTRIMEAGIVVDDLIIIHDEAPYDYLLKKWHLYKFKQKVVNFESEEEKREEDDHLSIVNIIDSAEDMEFEGESTEIDIETVAIENYINDIKQFETNFENFQQTFTEVREKIITCNLKAEENIVENIVKCMNERYRLGASIMTNEEKERETEEIDAMETIEPEDTLEEDEDEEEIVKQTVSKDNRRLGETGPFCPVALSRHNVFWKGKEQFGALFLDKMYLLSSEKALKDFIRDPYEFITYDKPLKLIPPLRICIVGPSGSGKTTLARALSKENGLAHVDFLGCLDMYMKERGIPLVGCKHEDDVFSFDADDPSKSISEKMELPEDLEDQQYNIDKTTIQTFVRKYLKEGAMLPKRMLQECLLNYFRVPYNKCGIILDSFPNCTYDVEAALDNFAVPEIVIELQCSCDTVLERMVPVLFDSWSTKQSERKVQEENRYAEEFEIFMERKEKWIEKGLRERRQQRTNQSVFEETADTEENTKDDEEITDADLSRQTLISEESWDFEFEELDEEQAMIDRMELEDLWRKEFPEPIKFEDWEDPEAAKQRISREVQLAYEVNGKNLLSIRTMLEEESITWKVVNAEGKESSVFLAVLKILDPFIFRNSSMLERTYEVDVETAERLLDCGYYFLSSFGRYCPVQIYEGKIPFQMFLPMEALRQVYPVLHRQYVYFIAGEERLSAFLKHPLKYLEQDSCVPLIPAHISIIGPPKCGKSTLAKRFATTYGMKLITRGHSLRHILKNFAWTELSRLTETHLRGGHVSPEESIARAVEFFSMDPRSASQGYILDGFPANRPEAEELAFLGIRPMIVVDLKADLNFCLQCLANETERLKKPPCFSPCYLSHQYEDWQIEGRTFRDWLTKFAQNVVELDGTVRKWAVWTRANDEVCFRFARIKKYFREADYDKVHSLAYMCVSPYEFRQRQSQFETFCPVCLRHEGSMNFSGPPPDHQGMFQFREYYYWICPRHVESFYKEPLEYLPPLNTVVLPADRPRMIEETIDIDHACWAKRLRADGFCLVTYVDNLPKRKLIRGRSDLGILHEDQLYLFCSENCRGQFLRQYFKYSKIEINFRQNLPAVEVKNLPNLGFLEQTVAALIVQAVNKIGVLRPKLPGMTPQITAAIYIGAYLKVHHTSCALNEIPIYEQVTKRMEARSQIIDVATRNIKKRINPFVSLPPVEPEVKRKFGKEELAASTVKAAFVKFRRSSPTQNFFKEEDVDGWSTYSYPVVN